MANNKRSQHFHPLQLAICGFSGGGKSTLISKLLRDLSGRFSVGYVKHDVHGFQMDREGKDTNLMWQCGAQQVFISDKTHSACLSRGAPAFHYQRAGMLDCDFVLLEGYKSSPYKKILVIDKDRQILEDDSISDVMAYVGQDDYLDLDKPYFHRDDLAGITDCILSYFNGLVREAPLYGLVLTGGHSTRMTFDKAKIEYRGKMHGEYCFDLLSGVCDKVYLSSRPAQWQDSPLGELPQIHDRFVGFGPMGGILSAMETHHEATWLVVACDLPFLDEQTIAHLVKHRNAFKMATCFQSAYNEFPEPLCAIYEPKIKQRLYEYMAAGYYCPRKVLINSPVEMLTPLDAKALDNINRYDEYVALSSDNRVTLG